MSRRNALRGRTTTSEIGEEREGRWRERDGDKFVSEQEIRRLFLLLLSNPPTLCAAHPDRLSQERKSHWDLILFSGARKIWSIGGGCGGEREKFDKSKRSRAAVKAFLLAALGCLILIQQTKGKKKEEGGISGTGRGGGKKIGRRRRSLLLCKRRRKEREIRSGEIPPGKWPRQ